jgi:hypothetical protein
MFVSMIPLKKVILEKRIFDYLFSQKTVGYRSYTSPYTKKIKFLTYMSRNLQF